jgi:SAM-dependent methyltransferase
VELVKNSTMGYFDHFVQYPTTHVGNWIKNRSRCSIFTIIASFLLNKHSRILEIGGGMGELALFFRNANYEHYVIVEPNSYMRESLIKKGFITKNYLIPSLKEEDNTYDAIILIDVFEHLNDMNDACQFMEEAKRVLIPGGFLFILSPDYLHWKAEFFNGDYSHSYVTTVRRLFQLFYNMGFRTERFFYISGFFKGNFATIASYMVRFFLFFVGVNFINNRLYNFKLTFLRQFLIVGTSIHEK